MSPTRRLVVCGLIGCLGVLRASAQAPLLPSRVDPAPFYDVDPTSCARVDRSGEPVSLVGLTEDVDPAHAPIPANPSERLLFRQVYETLVHIGCDLTLQPGLAASWHLDGTGTNWIIALRRDARFSDGTAVTARDVIASWTHGGSTLRADVSRFVSTATALDEVTLSVVLQTQTSQDPSLPGSPAVLAQPALAVARFVPDTSWPLGTRDVRVEGPDAGPGGRATITLVAAPISTTQPTPALAPTGAAADPPTLRFLISADRDARDLLDRNVDLLLTRDPATLAYADRLAQFDSLPLPWLRSYVFVSRENAPNATLTPDMRRGLADDAVTGEAQGSSFDWTQIRDRCTTVSAGAASRAPANTASVAAAQNRSPQTAENRSGRLAYDRTDSVARSLAERIAALASSRSADANAIVSALLPQARSRKLQTIPLHQSDLTAALNTGADAGYVLALDRTAGCGEIAPLQERAPWIRQHPPVPLVDTRLRAIIRRGRSHPAMEWDGSLLIGGLTQVQ
jgi:hypothetical protein